MKQEPVTIPNHGFPPIINKESQTLILGSFPSVQSRKSEFFYMYPQNRFWSVLSELFQLDFNSVDSFQKREYLLERHIALYDVIESCTILGSKDSSITNVNPTDIVALIENTKVKHIFLNGKTAYNLFLKYNPSLYHMATYLPSTSSANASFSLERLVQEWQVLRQSIKLD